MLVPNTKVPNLKIDLINDTQWELEKQDPEKFTLLVFYRGYHCPKCKEQLENLKTNLTEFTDRGVNVIGISMDHKDRAKKSGNEWAIDAIPIGYGMTEKTAREWGLYISEAISESETAVFSEPGLFLVQPDRTLFMSSVQSMPFARPKFSDLLKAIDFVQKENYPPRGTKA
ncbi:MAG: peroxiredoxin-like family protein [Marinirhabdus sp.]|nr:peroxiredoxin-like family protein [Marinirhabdus sp.]